MKKALFICSLILVKSVSPAGAAVLLDQDWTVNTAIAADPVGTTVSETFNNLSGAPISDVTVNLNISGGLNGALYGYLVLQDANGNVATEFLLNQVGTSATDPIGSTGSGFNVTLSDDGTTSIHSAPGTPTGVWQPDSASTLAGTFGGLTANGTWTLFLTDKDSGGGTVTLNSWGLDVTTAVPEVSATGWLPGLGALLMVGGGLIRNKRRTLQKPE